MSNLYLCERPYPLYRTLIKAIYEQGKHDVVLSNHVKGMEKILQPLRESGIFRKVYFIDDVEYNKFFKYGTTSEFCKFPKGVLMMPKKMYLYLRMQKKAKEMALPEGLDIMAYDNIYVNDAASSMLLYLYQKKQKFICVEHARNVFQINFEWPYRFAYRISGWLERIGLCYGLHGSSRYVKAIEVTDANNLIPLIKEKPVIEVNLDKLLEKLSEDDKDKIFRIYSQAYQLDFSKTSRISILITEYLYGNAQLPDEETQIKVYHKIIEEYMKEADIILIKPHPRDPVDYTNFVPNSIVLDAAFSVEILNLSQNLYFERAIAVTSSSIHSFTKAKECILLGKEYLHQYMEEKDAN